MNKLLFVALLGLASCGTTLLGGSSPTSIVKDYYTACNAGNYSTAENYLSEDARNLNHGSLGQLAGGTKAACDHDSRNGTVTTVEIKSESVRGEGATVIANIHFKNGSVKIGDVTQMIKENGNWKVTTGGN